MQPYVPVLIPGITDRQDQQRQAEALAAQQAAERQRRLELLDQTCRAAARTRPPVAPTAKGKGGLADSGSGLDAGQGVGAGPEAADGADLDGGSSVDFPMNDHVDSEPAAGATTGTKAIAPLPSSQHFPFSGISGNGSSDGGLAGTAPDKVLSSLS